MLGAYLVPSLAEKLTSTKSDKHKVVSAASLLMNFLVPIVVIVYLDSKCWGRFSVAPDAGQEKIGWFSHGKHTSSRSLCPVPLTVPISVPLIVPLIVPLLARPLSCTGKRCPVTPPLPPQTVKSHIAFRGTLKGTSRDAEGICCISIPDGWADLRVLQSGPWQSRTWRMQIFCFSPPQKRGSDEVCSTKSGKQNTRNADSKQSRKWRTFRILFFFFLFGGGEREEPSEQMAGGVGFYWKLEGGGGQRRCRGPGGAHALGACLKGGGGKICFLFGPKCPPRVENEENADDGP